MDAQIVAVYAVSDDLLRALCHSEDPQCRMSDAEVMTTAVVVVLFFGGNFELARGMQKEQGYTRTRDDVEQESLLSSLAPYQAPVAHLL